jgi:hypothetical protein
MRLGSAQGRQDFFRAGLSGMPHSVSQPKSLMSLRLRFGNDAPIVDEEPGSKPVIAELRDQITQGTRIVHVAVEDLMEQRQAFLLRDGHSDLDQGPAFHSFLVFSQPAQRTAAAVKISIGDVTDRSRWMEAIVAANGFKHLLLPGLGI